MIVIFNLPAAVMALAAITVGFAASLVIPNAGAWAALVGVTLVGLDLAYRLGREGGHWFSPGRGGSVFFLPVWLYGAVLVVVGIALAFVPESSPNGGVAPAP